jgi:DNA invertase Pin-like site-specific DNA recombinase
MTQVRENTESTARQYALAEVAVRLGRAQSQVEVIDTDLGLSGRSAANRSGFKDLVGRVCLGEVGAIFGLEVSRLARSSADLSRLLELARLTDTLIVDADGVYDLADINDRLVLGVKNQMSEAELHFLASRLQGAKQAAAERGELRIGLPVGYIYDDDGRVVIDPDSEVQAAITDLFAAFRAGGSAFRVVAAFKDRLFPKRAYGGTWAGHLDWGRLTHSRVVNILDNPVYAGAYVYGRAQSRRVVDPDGTVRTKITRLPHEKWPVLIHDHHEAYVSWEDYLANQTRLAANLTRAGARPPREGHALCQGIIYCGSCGHRMSTHYRDHGFAYYECSSKSNQNHTPTCRSITAETIDNAVAERLLDALNPAEMALALTAADEVADRRHRRGRAAELAVERARYEAQRAERAFHSCEPENRLVARNLESRWEARLAALAEAETALAQTQAATPPLPTRAELEALTSDVITLWHAKTTSPRDRKRLLRTLIADISLLPEPDMGKARIGIRWHTGTTDEIVAARRMNVKQWRRTDPAAIDMVRDLAHLPNSEIAQRLDQAGYKDWRRATVPSSRGGQPAHLPRHPFRRVPRRRLPPRFASQVAKRLGVSHTIIDWIDKGWLTASRGQNHQGRVPFSPEVEQACRERIASSNQIHRPDSSALLAGILGGGCPQSMRSPLSLSIGRTIRWSCAPLVCHRARGRSSSRAVSTAVVASRHMPCTSTDQVACPWATELSAWKAITRWAVAFHRGEPGGRLKTMYPGTKANWMGCTTGKASAQVAILPVATVASRWRHSSWSSDWTLATPPAVNRSIVRGPR